MSPRFPDPAWRSRVAAAMVFLAVLWPMLAASEFKPWILFDPQSLRATAMFLGDFLRPSFEPEFLRMVLCDTWQTIAIATAGLSLALAAAIPATILITERLSVSRLGTGRMHPASAALRQSLRWVLVFLRSVPELVWALLFVRIVGLGPTAGVLAIALSYSGMLAKVYAEILESSDAHATGVLLANGSGRLPALLYGALPESSAELVSYTVYRWECAIRGSAVMGFVGAGGLGQMLKYPLSLFQMQSAATVVIAMLLLVALVDAASYLLRRTLTS